MLSNPKTVRPLKSGRLKVVEPLPAPYKVPIVEKRSEKEVLLTAEPSQRSHPEGAALPAKETTVPLGTELVADALERLVHELPL
jgi:hypothetical protein